MEKKDQLKTEQEFDIPFYKVQTKTPMSSFPRIACHSYLWAN